MVGVGIAGQLVGQRAADHAVDAGQGVGVTPVVGGRAGRQVHRHALRAGTGHVEAVVQVGRQVEAGAADQRVTATAADQHVAAGASGQPVGTGAAEGIATGITQLDRVAEGTAVQVLDAADQLGMAVAVVGHRAGAQVDLHRPVGVLEEGHVVAGTAMQRIGAGAAGQPVIAVTAVQGVVTVCAKQAVIAIGAGQHVVAAQAFQQVGARVAGDLVGEVTAAAHVLDALQRVRRPVAVLRRAGGEIDHHARRRPHVVGPVLAAAAVDLVVALAAFERLELAGVAAGQGVVEGRAAHALDAGQRVGAAHAVLGGAGAGAAQRDDHTRGADGVVGPVVAAAAVDAVVTAAAHEPFQPVAHARAVGGQATGQHVGRIAAAHAFDARQHVDTTAGVGGRALAQMDRDAGRAEVVAHLVEAAAAVDPVAAAAAVEGLGHVGAVAALELVVEVRAAQLVDVDQRVAAGLGTHGRAGEQTRRDRRTGTLEVRPVGIGLVQRVGDGAAVDDVVAGAAVEHLEDRRGAAQQPVAEAGAGDEIEVADLVDAAQAVADLAGRGVQHDAGGRTAVVQRVAVGVVDAVQHLAAVEDVVAGTAHDGVVAGTAFDGVVAGIAEQPVVAAQAAQQVVAIARLDLVGLVIAFQRVGEVAAAQVLDVGQGVVAIGTTGRAGGQADHHASAGGAVVRHPVDAGAAVDAVVAPVAAQEVAVVVADQHVIEVGADHAFDAGQLVIAVTAGHRAGLQVDLHAIGGTAKAVVHDVEATAAVDAVGAQTAREQIVRGPTDDGVVTGATQHAIDADQRVGAGITPGGAAIAGAIQAGQPHRDGTDHVAVVGIVELAAAMPTTVERVVALAAAQRVFAALALEHVVASQALDEVVAVAALEVVDAVVALERVVEAAAAQVLEVGQRVVAFRPRCGVGAQADIDRPGAEVVGRAVEAVATVQAVIAGIPTDEVVAGVAGDHVGMGRAQRALEAVQRVVAGCAGHPTGAQVDLHRPGCVPVADDVVAVAADHPVVAGAGVEQVVIGRAQQGVAMLRAQRALDADQRVAADAGTRADTGHQVHGHATRGVGVVGIVVLEQRLVGAAIQHIVAGTATQRVLAVATFEPVVAGLALEQVAATQAAQHVVAATALDVVARVVAFQRVGKVAAAQVLDVAQRVVAIGAG